MKRNRHINILLSALFLLHSAILSAGEQDSIPSNEFQCAPLSVETEGELKPKRKKNKKNSGFALFKFQSKALRKTFKTSNKFNKKHRFKAGKKRYKNRHSGAMGHKNKLFKQKKNKSKLKKKNFHDMNSRH